MSCYELHFFNAPAQSGPPTRLNEFASLPHGPVTRLPASVGANIGPDSTKNIMISTHIDKRWGFHRRHAEIDFDFQNRQIMKIHQAMIYGFGV